MQNIIQKNSVNSCLKKFEECDRQLKLKYAESAQADEIFQKLIVDDANSRDDRKFLKELKAEVYKQKVDHNLVSLKLLN